MTPMTDNPLLDFSGLPRFDAITRRARRARRSTRCSPRSRAAIEAVATDTRPPTWDTVVEPLDDALEQLDRAWGAVRHLNAVVNTPALRDAYNANLPQAHRVPRRPRAGRAPVRALPRAGRVARVRRRSPGAATARRERAARFPPRRRRARRRPQGALQGRAGGARASCRRSSTTTCSTRPTRGRSSIDDEAALAGVPADVRAGGARRGRAPTARTGCKLTLQMPCYLPVMQYAENRALRATLHRGFATRASELGSRPEWDNTPVIARILELRREEAQLLGYRNFAEVSLVAEDGAHARRGARVPARPRARARARSPSATTRSSRAFARDELGIADFAPWDVAYASEKLKARRYAFSEQEVKQYFPEERVLAGLFRVVETIYGVTIRAARARRRGIRPCASSASATARARVVGQFYLDLYAREGKQGGAWMDDAINRRRIDERVQHPVAYLTCNFRAPVGGKPALFTHDEVITLFHEFGHGLHQLLTRVDVLGVSGIQGVEWDAVELPSQFMENFCWEWDVLAHMTAPRRHRRAAAARAVRQACSRRRTSRAASAWCASSSSRCSTCCCTPPTTPRRRRVPDAAGGARRRARRSRRRAAPAVRPLHARVRPHLRRRLRGRLLQLQVGRGAVRRRVQPVRGGAACCRRRPAPASATRCSPAAAADRRSNRSSPSGAAPPNSTRFCGIME